MDKKTAKISHTKFSSAAFPSRDDMALWNCLTSDEQRAVIMRDISEGLSGAAAKNATQGELMAKALAKSASAENPT